MRGVGRTRGAALAVAGALGLAVLAAAAPVRASLTTSEAEQVRGYVTSATHADRVRAYVARPDLSADEAAAAMTGALVRLALDERRMAFLGDVVGGAPSAAARPVLALATVRGLLARVETIYAQHPADLQQSADLVDVARAYSFVAVQVVAAGDAGRADLGRAIAEHLGHEAGLLRLDVPVALPIARVRAQAALALFDAMPEGSTHRVDAADKLGLAGARRSALVALGVLVLDGGDGDARVGDVRALLDRLPGAREGTEAVFVGDERAAFHARAGVVSTGDAPAGVLPASASPWGDSVAPPAAQGATLAVARGLAAAAVRKALERRPSLHAPVDHDGADAVAKAAAMLAVDAPRTVQAAAAAYLVGKREAAAALCDALGALAVFAPAGPPTEGLTLPLGQGRVTHVSLDPTGVATAFQLDGRLWRVDRDATGAVSSMRRDGAPVIAAMLAPPAAPATSPAPSSPSPSPASSARRP
jgi:hypothetical protein